MVGHRRPGRCDIPAEKIFTLISTSEHASAANAGNAGAAPPAESRTIKGMDVA
jgi:hypothetical protein